uniref:Uncharacterized protein n=1 Tax=viral metagenome TaxID=1070528 RepID=A0A6C0JQQ4_9ZZZZ
MFLIYENSVLNKIIISSIEPFFSLSEDKCFSIEKIEDFDFSSVTDLVKDEIDIFFLVSSNVDVKSLESMIKLTEFLSFNLIIKDFEDVENKYFDNCIMVNWYIYWSKTQNVLIKDYSVDKELLDKIFLYFQHYPSKEQRQIIEYLNYRLSDNRNDFLSIFCNQQSNTIQFKGKKMIEEKQKEINKSKNRSIFKVVDNVGYKMIVSNCIESAFQILDKPNIDIVMLFDVNLKKNNIDVTIVTKTKKENKILFCNISRKDTYLSYATINMDEFIHLIKT